MTPIAHALATYLLIKTFEAIFSVDLTFNQEIFIIIFGNINDLDYYIGRLFGKTGESHHAFFTHTIPGIFVIWGSVIALANILSFELTPFTAGSILASLFLHLILDDTQYWFYKFGLQGFHFPQINWLYPFRDHQPKDIKTGDMNKMIKQMRFSFITEAMIVSVASIYLIEKLV